MNTKKINSPVSGLVGYLHEFEYNPDSVLVFQLPRQTNMMNDEYVKHAVNSIKEVLPNGKKAIVIGADINIYEIAGTDAVTLILKGII